MLFGLFKSKEEKARDEYMKYLSKMHKAAIAMTAGIDEDDAREDSKYELWIIMVGMGKFGMTFEQNQERILNSIKKLIAKKYGILELENNLVKIKNEFLENMYNEVVYDFYIKYRDLKLPNEKFMERYLRQHKK